MSDRVRICNLNSESFVLHKGNKKKKKKRIIRQKQRTGVLFECNFT